MPVEINGTRYLQVTEVADTVGVTRQTLWRWRRDGVIPVGRKYRGRQIIYTQSEVELIQLFAERIEPIDDSHRREKTLFEGEL
jgi:predicted DNA-binding transcriptional regulator AlpA